MDYSVANDDAINIAVGESMGWKGFYIHDDGSVTFRDDKGRIRGRKNYCNNPTDAWPIIVENRLYVDPIFISDWSVTSECDSFRMTDKNPLRAAMIVFLMMQEGKCE